MWPSDPELLPGFYHKEIQLLYNAYKIFFDKQRSETEEEVLSQWDEVKMEIHKEVGLRVRKFHELWVHMLIHFYESYALVFRLVVISMLVPTDTSECERVFSLMNDLKTSERNRLGQDTLKHLMPEHTR